MEVLGHDHISSDHEAVALASFFKNGKDAVTRTTGAQFRPSVITGTGDKVQMVSAVSAMQSGRHRKTIVQAFVVPALAKNARTGHPFPKMGKRATVKGWATRPVLDSVLVNVTRSRSFILCTVQSLTRTTAGFQRLGHRSLPLHLIPLHH